MTTTRRTLARTVGCGAVVLLVLGTTACSQDSKEFTRAEPATTTSASVSPSPSATAAASTSAAAPEPASSSAGSSSAGNSATTSSAARPRETAAGQSTAAAGPTQQTASEQTWYRSSSGLYRSRNKACVTAEENWQAAVRANKKSAAEAAHASALDNGCDPAVWTPNGAKHETVYEAHFDGEGCTEAQGGTIAVFDDTYAVCTQQVEGVWTWEVAER